MSIKWQEALSDDKYMERLHAQRDRLWHREKELEAEVSELRSLVERLTRERDEARAQVDGAYTERNRVVAAMAKMALALGWRAGTARTAIEGWEPEWRGCVYIDLPTGQASWHYHDREAHLFSSLPPYTRAWDGHTTPEKYDRLAALRRAIEAAEGEK